jgi:hypothetical protein
MDQGKIVEKANTKSCCKDGYYATLYKAQLHRDADDEDEKLEA